MESITSKTNQYAKSVGKGIANSMTDKEAEQLDHFEA